MMIIKHYRTGSNKLKHATLLTAVLCLSACGGGGEFDAPVVNLTTSKFTHYTARPGDNFYSIAWANGVDPAALSRANHLRAPYRIKIGKVLRIPQTASGHFEAPVMGDAVKHLEPPDVVYSTRAIPSTARAKPRVGAVVNVRGSGHWAWPVHGSVVAQYSPGTVGGNRGLDLRVCPRSPVRAASAGDVVYSDSGLKGYGKLVIVKHAKNIMSAYAYNQSLKVKTGQHVKAGQVIAYTGLSPASESLLHFEVRKHGRPVNPLQYLRGKSASGGRCKSA